MTNRRSRLAVVLSCALGFIAAATVPSIGGCSQRGMIAAENIDGLIGDVTTRHDHYVSNDTTLTEADKITYLRSSELLRTVVKTAKNEKGNTDSGTDMGASNATGGSTSPPDSGG